VGHMFDIPRRRAQSKRRLSTLTLKNAVSLAAKSRSSWCGGSLRRRIEAPLLISAQIGFAEPPIMDRRRRAETKSIAATVIRIIRMMNDTWSQFCWLISFER
jgi:hypothetical protein